MVARLQGFNPRSGPYVPANRSWLRRRGAPGVWPLSRFRPQGRMPKHNLHALISGKPHELDFRAALQGLTDQGIGLTLSSLPTRLGFSTFPSL